MKERERERSIVRLVIVNFKTKVKYTQFARHVLSMVIMWRVLVKKQQKTIHSLYDLSY